MLPAVTMAVALAARCLFLLTVSDAPTFLSPGMDAGIYRDWADRILAGQPPDGPFYRAPLYPWLLAVLGWITDDTFWPVRVLQVIVSSVMAGQLALLARRNMSARAGWIAGLGWALYGTAIVYDGEGLIASLFTSGVIGLLLLFDEARRGRWWISVLTSAVLLAVLSLLRANALAYIPIALWVLWGAGRERKVSLGRRATVLLGGILLGLALLSPVLIHNARTGGGAFLSGQGGINLFLGNHPAASGAYAVDPDFGRDWTRAETETRAQRAEGRSLTMAQVSRHYAGRALEFWRDQPGQALLLTGRKLLALVNARELGNNRPLGAYLHHGAPGVLPLVWVGFPLIMTLALAFAVPAWRHQPGLRPAILLVLVHGAVVIAFFVNARYRLPIAPALLLIAAYGVDRLLTPSQAPGRFRIPPVRIATLLLAGALVLLPRPIPSVDEDEAWQLHHANALLRLDRSEESSEAYRKLLRAHPTALHGHLNLAVLHAEAGRLDSARVLLERELAAHPRSARAWNTLGTVHERQGAREAALDAYRSAYNLDPGLDEARLNLASLLARSAQREATDNRWDQALRFAAEAAAVAPDLPRHPYNYALLIARTGRLDEAERALLALQVDHPDFSPAREALARLRAAHSESTPPPATP